MQGDVPQIVAAKEGLRAFAGRAVTGSVKTVAANAVFRAPCIRHGVGGRRFIHESVRKGLHDRDQRNAGQLLAKCLDRRDVGRVVRGREEGKLLHRGQEGIVDKLWRVERTGMNRLKPNRPDLRQTLQRLARPGDFRQALADGGRVIGALAPRLADALDAALSEDGFCREGVFGRAILRDFKQAVLERGTADIWDQDFHS